MRIVTERQLAVVLGARAGTPRVVVGGNFATPWRALSVLDGTPARYRLFALNAQAGMPNREGVTLRVAVRRAGHARAEPGCATFLAGCRWCPRC